MKGYNVYSKVHQMRETGFSQRVITKALSINHKIIKRYWDMKKTCEAILLILDGFLLHTITDEREVKILFEILEKRCEINLSTIICSQWEAASWSSMILNDERPPMPL